MLSLSALSARLGSLPLRVTHWPYDVQELLTDLGVRTIGDCLRLPRDGFARRVGRVYLDDLDRAFGRRFDLRAEFTRSERWSDVCELYQESSNAAVFMTAVEHMLDRLVVNLRRRQAQVRSLKIVFEHRQHPPTLRELRLGRAYSRARPFGEPASRPSGADRLARSGDRFAPLHGSIAGVAARGQWICSTRRRSRQLAHVLLERLRGRLGSAAVYGMVLIAEHRPEHAWSKATAEVLAAGAPRTAALPSPWSRTRPLWLLPMPVAALFERGAALLPRYARMSRGSGTHRERLVGRAGRRPGLLHGRELARSAFMGLQGSE